MYEKLFSSEAIAVGNFFKICSLSSARPKVSVENFLQKNFFE
jgi:hypothetical protein